MRVTLWAVLLVLPALAGCSGGAEEPNDRVVIETDLGDIVLELAADKAPLTVENFLKYVDDGFYDGTLFHRIIEDFMVQGGGMDADGTFKDPTYPPVKNEASGLKNTKYSISMARQGPDTATNQFFINHADNTFLDPTSTGAGYAVFGHVVAGHEVVDAIAAVPVEVYEGRPDQHCQGEQDPRQASCPVDEVVIHTIRRAEAGEGDGGAGGGVVDPATPDPEPVPCVSAPAEHTPADIDLTGDLQAGLITPHVWNLCSSDERMLLWAHNSLDEAVDVALSATIDGAAPADGWELTFEEDSLHLEADGTRDGRQYPSWGWTVLHLTVPDDASGTHDLVVTVGDVTVEATLVVAPERTPTVDRGDRATVTFDGDFADSGEGFWEGTIPNINVGSGGLVTGVDLGLLGLGLDETASLIVPPALAYGYDNPAGSRYEQFNGEWLTFTVTVNGF